MTSPSTQKGAALLLILTLLVAAMVVFVTSTLSVNVLRSNATETGNEALHNAYQALVGYAQRATPPGQLPCPDADGDGVANLNAGQCTVSLGRLPHVSLDLPELRDGYNSPIWYALNPNLNAASGFRVNSSTPSTLTFEGSAMAFLVIAPGRPFENQNRDQDATVTDFLEGVNADVSTSEYAQITDDKHNDVLLGFGYQEYWSSVEKSVLGRVGALISQYQAACGQYPWAADFGSSPFQSVDNLTQGNLPLDTALPSDWDTGCAVGLSPSSWMVSHWGHELYYAMCSPVQGDCLSVGGDVPGSHSAVIVAPGVALNGQARPTFALTGYYESSNANADSHFTSKLDAHFDGSFNDIVYPPSP